MEYLGEEGYTKDMQVCLFFKNFHKTHQSGKHQMVYEEI